MKAWHYTKGVHAYYIVSENMLRLSEALLELHEKPVVWFSLEPHFDLSALAVGFRTLEEQACGPGAFRFGLPDNNKLLHRITHFKKHSGISSRYFRQISTEQGHDPYKWLVSYEPVPIFPDCTIEYFSPTTQKWSSLDTFKAEHSIPPNTATLDALHAYHEDQKKSGNKYFSEESQIKNKKIKNLRISPAGIVDISTNTVIPPPQAQDFLDNL